MQEEQQQKTAKAKQKDKEVDTMVLTAEGMITFKRGDRKLVSKRPAMEANQKKHCAKKRWMEEEQAVVPPAMVAQDHVKALDDGNELVLPSSLTTPLPLPPFFAGAK